MYTLDNCCDVACCDGYSAMGISDTTLQCMPDSWSNDPQYTAFCDCPSDAGSPSPPARSPWPPWSPAPVVTMPAMPPIEFSSGLDEDASGEIEAELPPQDPECSPGYSRTYAGTLCAGGNIQGNIPGNEAGDCTDGYCNKCVKEDSGTCHWEDPRTCFANEDAAADEWCPAGFSKTYTGDFCVAVNP